MAGWEAYPSAPGRAPNCIDSPYWDRSKPGLAIGSAMRRRSGRLPAVHPDVWMKGSFEKPASPSGDALTCL